MKTAINIVLAIAMAFVILACGGSSSKIRPQKKKKRSPLEPLAYRAPIPPTERKMWRWIVRSRLLLISPSIR